MAIYKIFPKKDASIYSESPSINTGLDPIIEMSTYIKNTNPQSSRALIQFDNDEISSVINTLISGSTFNTYLKVFAANVTGLNLTNVIECYPISGSWGMGTGKFGDSPIVTNGVSWDWQDTSGSINWPTASFGDYATGSYSGSSNAGGGVWYTGSSLGLNILQTQSFNYTDKEVDLNLDVSNTILTWYSGGLPNEGFILKQQSSDEFISNTGFETVLRYFGADTNTIYPPTLEFRWDDFTFNTGSSINTVLTTPSSFISIYNNQGNYYSGSIERFRLAAIEKYPQKTYQTSSYYTNNFYLPESNSYYAVKDAHTNEFVIPFDTSYTKISADSESSYFDLYMSGLQPERYYTVLIKTTLKGTTRIFDEGLNFKVING